MTEQEREERKTAGKALRAVYDLNRCGAFTGWYGDQLRDMADTLADEVLHHDLPANEREIKRQKRLTILEILALPAEALQSAEAVAHAAGDDLDEDDDDQEA